MIAHVAGSRKEPRCLPPERASASFVRRNRPSQHTAPRAPRRGSSGSTARREGIPQSESPHRQSEGACGLLVSMPRGKRAGLADSCRVRRRRCCCCYYDPSPYFSCCLSAERKAMQMHLGPCHTVCLQSAKVYTHDFPGVKVRPPLSTRCVVRVVVSLTHEYCFVYEITFEFRTPKKFRGLNFWCSTSMEGCIWIGKQGPRFGSPGPQGSAASKTRGGQEADIEALDPSDPTRARRERETLIYLRPVTQRGG